MKPLPHNVHAERVLLSGLLREPELNEEAFTTVTVADLYVYSHRLVFGSAFDLWSAFRPVELAEIYYRLRLTGHLGELGLEPAVWLWDLFETDPTGADCLHAAHVVLELSVRRRAITRQRERLADLEAGRLSPAELVEYL